MEQVRLVIKGMYRDNYQIITKVVDCKFTDACKIIDNICDKWVIENIIYLASRVYIKNDNGKWEEL